MPFIQREVPAASDLVEFDAPEDYPHQNLLDFAAQRTMVGLLEQMQIFSAHAADIFTDILEEANMTFKRVQELSDKVANLNERIPEVEEFYKATPVQKLFENQRLMTSWKQNEDSQLFRPETNAACIAELFKDAFPPPNLEIMDPLMENGESALRKYTDPNFFVIEWVQAMEKQNEEARKARREKRKNRKQQVGARQVAVKKNVAVMAKYVYDPNTGEKILVQQSSGGSAAPQEITAAGTYAVAGQTDIDTNAMLAVPTTPTTPVSPAAAAPAPKESHHHLHKSKSKAAIAAAAPVAPTPSSPVSPVAPIAPAAPAAPPAPAAPVAPPAPMAPAAPPAPMAPAAPPAPGAPVMGGGGMGDLASQLGAAHLKAAPAPTKKVEARTDLMNMIRQGKKLRSAQDRVLSDAPLPKGDQPAALSVADILSRRIAVADSDDEDDDDDDEWD